MKEICECPICGDKMREIKRVNMYYSFIAKYGSFKERTCYGINHCLQILVDDRTKEIDLMKISLNSSFSNFVFIDFLNKKTRFLYSSNGEIHNIDIPKIIELDFPTLLKVKEKLSTLLILI